MSQELEFIEPQPGQWFYILEDYSAPNHSWNWHENAVCYGPFESLESAQCHEADVVRGDTSGATITNHERFKTTPMIGRLIAHAIPADAR